MEQVGRTSSGQSACELKVRQADQGDRDAWNRFVDAEAETPATCVFEWRDILRQAYGVRTVFLLAQDGDGRIRGTLPLYINRTLRGRRLIYSLRYGLVGDDAAVAALLDYAEILCGEIGAMVAQVTSGHRPMIPKKGLVRRTSLIMPLPYNAEMAWKGLRAKSRNMIRRAQKVGLTLSNDMRHADAVYQIYAQSLADKGVPIHTRRFFRIMLRHLGTRAHLLASLDGGNVVAGTVFFPSPRVAQYPIQAALPEALKAAPNQLMIWEMMQQAILDGADVLDFGESTPDSPTYRFKENFGACPEPLFYANLGPGAAENAPVASALNEVPAVRTAHAVLLVKLNRIPSLGRSVAKLRNRFGRVV